MKGVERLGTEDEQACSRLYQWARSDVRHAVRAPTGDRL
jgi:hypothetical protein